MLAEQKNAKQELDALHQKLNSSKQELDDITSHVVQAKQEVVEIDNTITTQRQKNKVLLIEYSTLSIKLTDIKQKIIDVTEIDKATREDLAVRIKAADERDVNLKIREMAVNQAEHRIQSNADLLNL